MPDATTVLNYPAFGQSVPKGRNPEHIAQGRVRDASIKGRIVLETDLPRDDSFRGSKISDGTFRDTLLGDASFHHYSFYKRGLFSIGKHIQFLPDFVNFSIRVNNTLFHLYSHPPSANTAFSFPFSSSFFYMCGRRMLYMF